MGYDFDFGARKHRKSVRRPGHNYRWSATYFVTIVTSSRMCWFGEVADGRMHLNALGEVIRRHWLESARLRPGLSLGEFVVMPNHIHGILTTPRVNLSTSEPLSDDRLGRPIVSQSLGSIMRGFKSAVTSEVNKIRQVDEEGSIWQRNYHEHIVRNAAEHSRITHYIRANPRRWQFDPENVDAQPDDWERSFWKSLEDPDAR